jgi:tRNA threonylcarbamoyladenosine biosynthesis protein TsaB
VSAGAPGLVCAFETSTQPPSVAVADAERVLEAELSEGRRHASDLLPQLSRLLREFDGTPRDLSLVCVGVGPGSYTGLRVGVATTLGLARGTGCAVVSVPSVAALAYAGLAPGEEGTVLLDARARQLYLARYRRVDEGVVELCPPVVTSAGQLEGLLPTQGPILGDGTVAEAAHLDSQARARLRTDLRPGARDVLELGRVKFAREGATPLDQVAPLYLRPFAVTARKR